MRLTSVDDIDDWFELRTRQHGVVSRRQLLERGFTDKGIQAQLDAGRWRVVHRGVYATHTGPLPLEARHWAAILACHGPAALSHESAAPTWNLTPSAPPVAADPTHLTVPFGLSAFRSDGLVLHRSRAFAHIVVGDLDPPAVGPTHTVLDLAVGAPDAQAAMRLVHRLASEGRIRAEALQRAVELRRPRRYVKAISDALALLVEGVEFELELRYTLDVERAHGLPPGRRQEPVLVDGRRRYEDVAYDVPAGQVIVRLDGHRTHRDRVTSLTDRRRAVAAAVDARPSVPFGWEEITGQPCRTAREVAAVLRGAGWRGQVGRCPACA